MVVYLLFKSDSLQDWRSTRYLCYIKLLLQILSKDHQLLLLNLESFSCWKANVKKIPTKQKKTPPDQIGSDFCCWQSATDFWSRFIYLCKYDRFLSHFPFLPSSQILLYLKIKPEVPSKAKIRQFISIHLLEIWRNISYSSVISYNLKSIKISNTYTEYHAFSAVVHLWTLQVHLISSHKKFAAVPGENQVHRQKDIKNTEHF